ncbi:unnamed protein product [Miscanthus lutarioriparius]|uniref:DUF4283 domain-containing protein n=1 Tax=Miscanthus lutarioriparius TaxID=422564 RepID=A0A811Q9E5_9POAL|nr:unnamed protein product [Miscanthus lutarioriparius]
MGVHFSFVRHNQGRNWRSLNFNQECWVILMGLPEDYWEDEFIDTVLRPFARTIRWDSDPDQLTRLIIRARVVDLESIPHFSVFFDGPGYNGQSWTVQCEILQHEHLGVDPSDDEQVPQLLDDGPPLFEFFGLGQQVVAPIAAHDPLPNMEANLNEQEEQNIQV